MRFVYRILGFGVFVWALVQFGPSLLLLDNLAKWLVLVAVVVALSTWTTGIGFAVLLSIAGVVLGIVHIFHGVTSWWQVALGAIFLFLALGFGARSAKVRDEGLSTAIPPPPASSSPAPSTSSNVSVAPHTPSTGDFVVTLEAPGPNKIFVIKEVRQYTGMGLKDAKNFIESLPRTLLVGVDSATALMAQTALIRAGASASVQSQQQSQTRTTFPSPEPMDSVVTSSSPVSVSPSDEWLIRPITFEESQPIPQAPPHINLDVHSSGALDLTKETSTDAS